MSAPTRPQSTPVGAAHDAAFSAMSVLAGAMIATMLDLGRRTGLSAALGAGPADAEVLANRTCGDERIAAEWLAALGAAGLVVEASDGRSRWSDEAAPMLGGPPGSPMDLTPGVELFAVLSASVPAVAAAYRSGGGLPAADYQAELATAMARMSSGWTAAVLPDIWIRSVPALAASLDAGGRVVEIGCGTGTALEALGASFPRIRATGFDLDERAVRAGQARLAGRADGPRIELCVQDAAAGLDGPYDLVLALSVLHDATDLDGLLRCVGSALAPDGRLLVVESPPLTGPFAAMLLATSTLYCVPTTRARGAVAPLGTLGLTPDRLADAAVRAGLAPGEPLAQVVPMVAATLLRRDPFAR